MGKGAEYIKKGEKKPVSEFGESVADLLDVWVDGIYHLSSPGFKRVDWSNDHYVEIMLPDHQCQRLATYDFSALTALVLLSHDRCIRVDLSPGNFRQVKLLFHPRKRLEPGMSVSVGMPTMEEHIAKLRARSDVKRL